LFFYENNFSGFIVIVAAVEDVVVVDRVVVEILM